MNNLRKNENKTLFINSIVFIVSFLVLSIFLLIPIFENNSKDASLFQLMISNISHLSFSSIIGWLLYSFIPLCLYLISFVYFLIKIILFIKQNWKINYSQYLFFQIIYLILLMNCIIIALFYYFSVIQLVLYVIGLLLLLSSLLCNYISLKKEMFVVCKNKDKPKKQYKKSTSFIVNSILSFLFCLSLIVFLLIMNIDYQGGDGTYSWLTIIFESMTPYLLFDSQNTFYNQFQSLILFVTTIIVVCYIIQLIVWWLKKEKSFSLSTLIFYEINFILCSSLFLIFDLDVSSQYRIITNLSLYLVLPGVCFGLYHLIYTLIQTKKVESIK